MNDQGVWFLCKGCGAPAGYYPRGNEATGWPPGSIAHTKPLGTGRTSHSQPSTIKCLVYQQLSPAEYWELHKNAKRIENPTDFKPVLG